MNSNQMIYQQINDAKTKGFTRGIPVDIGDLLPDMLHLMRWMIAQPEQMQRRMEFNLNTMVHGLPDPDDGLINKSRYEQTMPGDKPYDPKWVFMFRPILWHLMRAEFGAHLPRELQELLDLCQQAYDRSMKYAMQVMLELDLVHPGKHFHLSASLLNNHRLRLQYTNTIRPDAENATAKLHTDRSLWTQAYPGTVPGLCGPDGKLISHVPGEGIGFFGRQWWLTGLEQCPVDFDQDRGMPRRNLTPFWHGSTASEEFRMKMERLVAVFFLKYRRDWYELSI